MKINKKGANSVKKEEAHGGEGSRRLYLDAGELTNKSFQALTKGYLSAGGKFSWHSHEGIEEVMLVLKGEGVVRDRDGEYEYGDGDLFTFPSNIEHEIENTSDYENEYVFMRIKND